MLTSTARDSSLLLDCAKYLYCSSWAWGGVLVVVNEDGDKNDDFDDNEGVATAYDAVMASPWSRSPVL